MKLILDRAYKKTDYTIGRLYLNGKMIMNTLEDKDRGLESNMSLDEIKRIKIQDETAIPKGIYKIDLDTFSNAFGNRTFYKQLCQGKVPRLCDVKGYLGVLIHCGTNKDHTSGCILVGKNTIKGGLTESKECFTQLYKLMLEAKTKGEKIEIEIK